MPIEVSTKDCTALGDAELAAMADLAENTGSGFDLGFLSKQQQNWVLVTYAYSDKELAGFIFYTLERIGGTPAILNGILTLRRNDECAEVLKALIGDQYRKAVLAFPDEDVLIGSRLVSCNGYEILADLVDIVPRPGYKPTGEERAWARRIAKRFGAEHRIDDRSFVITGNGDVEGYLDISDAAIHSKHSQYASFFEAIDSQRRDSLCAFGWVMAEDLASAARAEDD